MILSPNQPWNITFFQSDIWTATITGSLTHRCQLTGVAGDSFILRPMYKKHFFLTEKNWQGVGEHWDKALEQFKRKKCYAKKNVSTMKKMLGAAFFFVGGHKLTHTFFPHQEQHEAGAQEKNPKNTTWTRAPTLSEITQSAFLRVTRRLLKRVMLATVQNLWCGSYSE